MGFLSFISRPRRKQRGGKESQYGFKTLRDPEDAVVDLVFLHGLTGDRERTWTAAGHAEPWPQTLLRLQIPNARVLTYGYDANVVKLNKVVSSNRIGDHAGTLLTALAVARDAGEHAENRPIIFVAHSLGGLVCQDALRTAALSGSAHHRKILECTRGVVFMGTPLTGSGLAAAAELLARWLKLAWNTNSRILAVLRRDSEVADRIQRDFSGMLESRAQEGRPRIHVACFYEELPLDRIGVHVVPKQAATYASWEAIGVHSNHMDIVRFSTATDTGFVLLVGVLKRWIASLDAQGVAQQHQAGVQAGPQVDEHQVDGNGVPPTGTPERQTATHEDTGRSGISIGGDVTGSNVTGGSQTIHGPLTIGR